MARAIHHKKLTRHRNFNKYWVCASCGQPRRKKSPQTKACKQCRSTLPPRVRLTTRRGEGDIAHQDSKRSKELMKAANIVREGLRFGHGKFPPAFPSREILDSIKDYSPNPRSRLWLCQVFLDGITYKGTLEQEICLLSVVEEVAEAMLSEKKMMQIRISSDLHKWLKLHAAKHDTTMTDIIIQYLEYLRRKSSKTVKVEQI